MSSTPIKSAHALLLNRLAEMQRVPHYATARGELALAEQTILQLEAENTRLKIAADGSEPGPIEAERKLFEADAEPYGFDLTRHECLAPEPWSEYVSPLTGHRWGGWLAARDVSSIDKAKEREMTKNTTRPPTPTGWSDTDWIKHLQDRGEWPHPLAGMHINQGSMDAAADAYEAEYKAANVSSWEKPTKFLQRFGDAIELLCAGHRPPDEMIEGWLDPDTDDLRLQSFCSDRGPTWAQGIGVVDAAQVLADQPTEGVDHEMTETKEYSGGSDPGPIEAERSLTTEDVLNLIADRAQWCRENGESDMRNILGTVRTIRGMLKDGKTRSELLAEFADDDDDAVVKTVEMRGAV